MEQVGEHYMGEDVDDRKDVVDNSEDLSQLPLLRVQFAEKPDGCTLRALHHYGWRSEKLPGSHAWEWIAPATPQNCAYYEELAEKFDLVKPQDDEVEAT